MNQEQGSCLSPSPCEEHQADSTSSWAEGNPELQLTWSLASLPPEVLEKIFGYLAHNVASLRGVAGVCSQFHHIACRVREAVP